MPITLENNDLQLILDLPHENYRFSRFDWSGKITEVRYKGKILTSTEKINDPNEHIIGKGLYNEFGINKTPGFEEAKEGDWFHKIGVGLLKKEGEEYRFNHAYTIHPLSFKISQEEQSIQFHTQSETCKGYAYALTKRITLKKDGFSIEYELRNDGTKPLDLDEYTHNFLAFAHENLGTAYTLRFPFLLQPECLRENVNPEGKLQFYRKHIAFKNHIEKEFFFSFLNGDHAVQAGWELMHQGLKIGFRETTSFKTQKVNLWGTGHVISPELFHTINLKPGESESWSRNYCVFTMD
jgi:hypothetical protein